MTTNKLTTGAIAVLNKRPLADRQRMLAHLEEQERIAKGEGQNKKDKKKLK